MSELYMAEGTCSEITFWSPGRVPFIRDDESHDLVPEQGQTLVGLVNSHPSSINGLEQECIIAHLVTREPVNEVLCVLELP